MALARAASGNKPCIGQQVAQQWWHGDIDGKQMQFGGVLGGASECDDLRPGEMECTLNLPCLTCFGRTCFAMVFLISFIIFYFILLADRMVCFIINCYLRGCVLMTHWWPFWH